MNIELSEIDSSVSCADYVNILSQLTTINIDKISVDQFKKRIELIKSNPYHKIIVAKYNGILVGTITVLIEPKFIHDLSFVSHIEDVVVDQKYRKFGIGKFLVEKAIEISKQFDCYKIILDCSKTSVDFYTKCGFKLKDLQMAIYLDSSNS